LERFIHFYPANGANQPSLYAVGWICLVRQWC
jgi:hypothetical protein